MTPTTNQPNVPNENSSCNTEKHINAIKNPIAIKMVPPHKVVVLVDINSFLGPLEGALGVFRQ